MPQFNRRELDVRAREYGFNRDTFEKVLRLRTILDFLNTHEYMREHLLLKGGTAINLTVFNLPRLSVDIDLDFLEGEWGYDDEPFRFIPYLRQDRNVHLRRRIRNDIVNRECLRRDEKVDHSR
jgi:predicted nucleotidyltransferase component of viral defense system